MSPYRTFACTQNCTRQRRKIGKKNMNFLRKIVIFYTKYPKHVRASHRSAPLFSVRPLTLNPGSVPATEFHTTNFVHNKIFICKVNFLSGNFSTLKYNISQYLLYRICYTVLIAHAYMITFNILKWGFIVNRRIEDHIFTPQGLCSVRNSINRKTYLAFLDLSKAFLKSSLQLWPVLFIMVK